MNENQPAPNDTIEAPPLAYGIVDPAYARGGAPWLDSAYIPFSKKWSPRGTDLHYIGCALWVLSTIAMRRVAVQDGRSIQHTPLYVQLVAPSFVWGKTTTARIATDLLDKLDLSWTVCSGQITPENFLRESCRDHHSR